MDVAEMAALYRRAQEVRDETVRQGLLQSMAQAAAASGALAKAKDAIEFEGRGKEPDPRRELVKHADAKASAVLEAAEKLLANPEEGDPIRAAEAIAAEAIAAEAIAAEALSVEATAVEAAEGVFSAEPLSAEAAMSQGAYVQGTEAVGAQLRSFVAENGRRDA